MEGNAITTKNGVVWQTKYLECSSPDQHVKYKFFFISPYRSLYLTPFFTDLLKTCESLLIVYV